MSEHSLIFDCFSVSCCCMSWSMLPIWFDFLQGRPICRKEAVLNFSRQAFWGKNSEICRDGVELKFYRTPCKNGRSQSARKVHLCVLKRKEKGNRCCPWRCCQSMRALIELERKAVYVSYSVQWSCLCMVTFWKCVWLIFIFCEASYFCSLY